jgi:hypothetical protein
MTDEERHTIETFKATVSLIKTGADGYPVPHPMLRVELDSTAMLALKVHVMLTRRDDLTAAERSVLNLVSATSRLIAATDDHNRDPAIPEAWFRARAELIEPEVSESN